VESLLLLAMAIVTALISIPLTYFAVHSHRELRHPRPHHTLHRLIVETHGE
jgi:hypothetical protein